MAHGAAVPPATVRTTEISNIMITVEPSFPRKLILRIRSCATHDAQCVGYRRSRHFRIEEDYEASTVVVEDRVTEHSDYGRKMPSRCDDDKLREDSLTFGL